MDWLKTQFQRLVCRNAPSTGDAYRRIRINRDSADNTHVGDRGRQSRMAGEAGTQSRSQGRRPASLSYGRVGSQRFTGISNDRRNHAGRRIQLSGLPASGKLYDAGTGRSDYRQGHSRFRTAVSECVTGNRGCVGIRCNGGHALRDEKSRHLSTGFGLFATGRAAGTAAATTASGAPNSATTTATGAAVATVAAATTTATASAATASLGASSGRLMRRHTRGSTVVEAALLLPLVLTLIIGTFEAGRAWMDYNILTHAVREGSRLASVTPSLQRNDPAVLQRINDILAQANIQTSGFDLLFTTPLRTGDSIRVRATADFQPVVTGLLPEAWTVVIPLRAEVITRYEV